MFVLAMNHLTHGPSNQPTNQPTNQRELTSASIVHHNVEEAFTDKRLNVPDTETEC